MPERFLFRSLLVALLFGTGLAAVASHNIAGSIAALRDPSDPNGRRYFITLTTYTDPSAFGVDRCWLKDGSMQIWSAAGVALDTIKGIYRTNGPLSTAAECPSPARDGEIAMGTIKKNLYEFTYTFNGPGTYEIRFFDDYRVDNITNIPNAGVNMIPLFLNTFVFIPPPTFAITSNSAFNSTPNFLNTPLDFYACTFKKWTHNPGGYDPDGDSLSYVLVPCMEYGAAGQKKPAIITGFVFPDMVSGEIPGSLTMDPTTGLITWDSPQQISTMSLAYEVTEWRRVKDFATGGNQMVKMGVVRREMAIYVNACSNNPPVIEAPSDTCVRAGSTIKLKFKVWDPDKADSVYLYGNNAGAGLNGPFASALANPATLKITAPVPPAPATALPVRWRNNGVAVDTLRGEITWTTSCDNIRSQHYQVDLLAYDNMSYRASKRQLTAHKVIAIHVIAPPVEGLMAVKQAGKVELTWQPGVCSNTSGYRIYRKLDSTAFEPDDCCSVRPASVGYVPIASVDGRGTTTYTDNLQGVVIPQDGVVCYVVTALIAPDNTESCPSSSVCVNIIKDNIFKLKASIGPDRTALAAGSVLVAWSQPKDMDTLFYPRPYTYDLERIQAGQPPVKIAQNLAQTDTAFTDTLLNTQQDSFAYEVTMYDGNGQMLGSGGNLVAASTIFLRAAAGLDRDIALTWNSTTPWTNSRYEVWRSQAGGPYTKVAETSQTAWVDTGLVRNEGYCYFVRSFGSYGANPQLPPVLINDSQQACDTAVDKTPPCFPLVEASGNCEDNAHTIHVVKPGGDCDDDTRELVLYFWVPGSGETVALKTFEYASLPADTTLYLTFGVDINAYAGIYLVQATDSTGNVTVQTPADSVDYCPEYAIANVLTPNSDGKNDYLASVRNRDIVLKRFDVYDRWGRLMFTNTSNSFQLWDGRTQHGEMASGGVYYYYLQYEEMSLKGNVVKELKGYITLVDATATD